MGCPMSRKLLLNHKEQAVKDAKMRTEENKEEPPKDSKEEKEMKHNIFESQQPGRISHSDMKQILKDAMRTVR